MIFELEPGNFKFTYVRGYACRSQNFNNMNELARNIRNISSSNMSASSGVSSQWGNSYIKWFKNRMR